MTKFSCAYRDADDSGHRANVRYEADQPPSLEIQHSCLLLQVPSEATEKRKQEIVAHWYQDQMRVAFQALAAEGGIGGEPTTTIFGPTLPAAAQGWIQYGHLGFMVRYWSDRADLSGTRAACKNFTHADPVSGTTLKIFLHVLA